MSDIMRPPLWLLPLLTLEVVDSSPKDLVRLLEAGTAAGNGGSRDDGASTPALVGNKREI